MISSCQTDATLHSTHFHDEPLPPPNWEEMASLIKAMWTSVFGRKKAAIKRRNNINHCSLIVFHSK